MCLLRSTFIYYFFYLKKEQAHLSNCLIYNIIEDRERIEIPFPLILEMVYAFPSAVNPIFPVQKRRIPVPILRPQDPLFLVCNHVTRRPCWGSKQKNISLKNLHENRVQFPEESNAFVLDHQHGRRDVTCKPAIDNIRKWGLISEIKH